MAGERFPVAVVLDNIRSMYNSGAFFRTCDAAGAEKLVLCGITAHPPQPGVAKTALGAERSVPWAYEVDTLVALRLFRARGYQLAAVETAEPSVDLFEWQPQWPVCIVFGNEVDGLSGAVLDACDVRIRIPMRGAKNSLNVATAGGIVLYELLRKWRSGGGHMLAVLAYGQSVASQVAPGREVRIKVKPLGVRQPEPRPEKEAGDEVVVRNDGTIVARSRDLTFEFPPTNRMKPVLQVTYSESKGRIVYVYRLVNRVGAADPISSVVLGFLVNVEASVPPPWFLSARPPSSRDFSAGILLDLSDDEYDRGILHAGSSLGPMEATCDGAPGLISVTYFGPPRRQRPGALTDGQFLDAASPWVRFQLTQLDTAERHQLVLPAIGPVVPMKEDSPERIRKEIHNASLTPELAPLQKLVRSAPLPLEHAGMEAWLAEMRKQQPPGILAEFLDAMIWRLKRLR